MGYLVIYSNQCSFIARSNYFVFYIRTWAKRRSIAFGFFRSRHCFQTEHHGNFFVYLTNGHPFEKKQYYYPARIKTCTGFKRIYLESKIKELLLFIFLTYFFIEPFIFYLSCTSWRRYRFIEDGDNPSLNDSGRL